MFLATRNERRRRRFIGLESLVSCEQFDMKSRSGVVFCYAGNGQVSQGEALFGFFRPVFSQFVEHFRCPELSLVLEGSPWRVFISDFANEFTKFSCIRIGIAMHLADVVACFDDSRQRKYEGRVAVNFFLNFIGNSGLVPEIVSRAASFLPWYLQPDAKNGRIEQQNLSRHGPTLVLCSAQLSACLG